MPQSLAENYLHVIFSTKNRRPIIADSVSRDLYRYIFGICTNLECPALNVGGYHDHVHILCRLSRKIALAQFLKEVKQASSKWIKTTKIVASDFYWQEGYGAFSVNKKELDAIGTYIDRQYVHHQTMDFKSELLALFDEYQIVYDEKYLWD
jgi:putative transposase